MCWVAGLLGRVVWRHVVMVLDNRDLEVRPAVGGGWMLTEPGIRRFQSLYISRSFSVFLP